MGRKSKYKSKGRQRIRPQEPLSTRTGSRSRRTHRSEFIHQDDVFQEEAATSSESDIPGYYFDHEKKAYFKILPKHFSCGGNFVTRGAVRRESGKKSSHSVTPGTKASPSNSQGGSQEPLKIPASSSSLSIINKSKKCLGSISNYISYIQTGQLSGRMFESHIKHQQYSGMKFRASWGATKVILPAGGDQLEAIQRIELNSRCDKAVCVWSIETAMSQTIQPLDIAFDGKNNVYADESGSFPVKIQPSNSFSVPCLGKISSLCLSPLSLHPGKLCVLYTTIFPLGDFNSRVSISNLEANARDKVKLFDFSVCRGAVWSSAWNQVCNRFSIGCERKCQVVDIHTRRQWVYSTSNSDALAQLFSIKNPHLLYNGTRSGAVLMLDLRTAGSNQASPRLNHKMPVVCLRAPKDENYLYASDFSGLICLWDLRMKKIVMKYSGLVNSHYQLPFYLDESEKYIYGTGSDSCCKLWDQTSGKIVTTIPPPLQDVPSDCLPMFPITHFSDHWTGHSGIVGAITGVGKKFFLSH